MKSSDLFSFLFFSAAYISKQIFDKGHYSNPRPFVSDAAALYKCAQLGIYNRLMFSCFSLQSYALFFWLAWPSQDPTSHE